MPYIEIEGDLDMSGLSGFDIYQIYNVLDCAVTAQLVAPMKSQLNENTKRTYERELRVQSLCLEMSSKGFPVNKMSVAELLWKLEKQVKKAESRLEKFCAAVGAEPFNENSQPQVAKFFYETLNLPTIYVWDHKEKRRKVSTDIKALETLRINYPFAAPFVNAVLAIREAKKMASVFKRGLEPSGKLRCSFSPSGTETGRLSSQQNPYGRGTNAQNLTDYVRHVIEAPDGFAIVNFDLKTAESIAVGYISGCRSYIDACLSGDLHTRVAQLNWKELPWTGDLKQDKKTAEQPFYRHFSYRDMAKRGGHGTNYYGKPPTVAKHLNVAVPVVEEFQRAYFKAFPEIPEWHMDTIARIQREGKIVTALGRERRFWGRSDDAVTHREAIAFNPQSLVADVWNEGLVQAQEWVLKEFKTMRRLMPDLLAQVHDAGVFLLPLDGIHQIIEALSPKLIYPVDFGDLGTMIIPTDASWGKTWNKYPKKPSRELIAGLKDYTPAVEQHW